MVSAIGPTLYHTLNDHGEESRGTDDPIARMYSTHAATFPAGPLGLVLGCREADSAAIVVSVKDGGSASRGGVRKGDVVSRIAGRRVGDYDSVLKAMKQVSRPVQIDFERENEPSEAASATVPEGYPPACAPPPPPAQSTKPAPPQRMAVPPAMALNTVPIPSRRHQSAVQEASPPLSKKKPPPPPPKATGGAAVTAPRPAPAVTSRNGWQTSAEVTESKGKIAERWEQLRQQHQARQEARLEIVRKAMLDDVARRTSELEVDHVAKKVSFFDVLFADALQTALKESEAMSERDREKACHERARRRRIIEEQTAADSKARRAPRPSIENVAAHPDELRVALSDVPRGMKLVYALVDVAHLEGEKQQCGSQRNAKMAAIRAACQHFASPGSTPEGSDAASATQHAAKRHTHATRDARGEPERHESGRLEDLAERTHTWHAYDGPIALEEAGTYAVLTKAVPVDSRAAARFEANAQLLEQSDQAPHGYADLASILVDAVRCGLLSKHEAYELLESAKHGGIADIQAERTKWAEAVYRRDPDRAAERAEARRLREQQRAAIIADIKAAALEFETDARRDRGEKNSDMYDFAVESYDVVASSGNAVLRSASYGDPKETRRYAALVSTAFDNFVDACAADETAPEYEAATEAADESQISSAVFELSDSPPIMWHEEHDAELRFVEKHDVANAVRRCTRCGGTEKLYANGDFVICRACALEGAGVLVDPGARRMWFSQMIEFYPSREIPLPKSHSLLAQILRALQSHPGIACRFEGHVNSTCGLDCDGSRPCKSAMCKTVPGGAMGLSTARAEAVKNFILACGIEPDRVYAQGFAGTRRLSDALDEENGCINRRVEVHTLLC